MSAIDNGLPLSPEQQACLCHGDAAVRPALALVLRLEGTLDLPRLQHALQRVVSEQPLLRHRMFRVAAYRGLRQAPGDTGFSGLEVQDRRDRPAPWTAFLADVEARCRAGFPLDADVLCRVQLCRVADTCHGLALVIADLLSDRGGLAAFAAALWDAYQRGDHPRGGDPQGGYPQGDVSDEAAHYGQYVEWREEMAQDEDAGAGRAYWQQHLEPVVGEDRSGWLRLPYRQARSRTTADAAVLREAVDAALAERLQALCAELGKPLDTVLQGAWWALLGRLAGQDRLLVGWRHDCRRDYEYFAGCIGLFEKSLPLVLALPAERSFADWLDDLEQVLEQHAAWQEQWPVEAPTLDGHFRAGFALECLPALAEDWQVAAREGGDSEFELLLSGECRDERLTRLSVRVDTCHYPAEVAGLLLAQYRTLLVALAENGRAALADLDARAPEEQALWAAFEGAPAADAGPQLPERIADWARRTPDALALVDDGARLSYVELEAQVERLARRLRQRGVTPGRVVALALPRSAGLVTALLAVWRAGGAWLPLDPGWPDARRRLLLEQAGAHLVLSERACWPNPEGLDVLFLDAADTEDFPACTFEPARADQPAYVLFTSGSMGTPKGVLVEHQSLLNYVVASSRALALERCRQFAMTSTVAADLGHTTLFGALFNGATLHVAADADVQDAARFAGFLAGGAIDCLKIVPSHLAALLTAESIRLPATVVLGGEAIPASLLDSLFRLAPDCRLYNHYGPTESTVGVLYRRLEPGQDLSAGVSLAQALDGCRVELLDDRLRPVPAGAQGELYIGGRQLARGYLGEAGGAAFVDDPRRPGERLYRSGDLGRLLPDGTLLLCGRRDHQVKVRGFRIEPAEVEQALLAESAVAQAVVQPWCPGESADLQLIAYVQPREGLGEDWLERLQEALAHRLPAAMVPARLFPVAQMPRLANGKVDRRGLPSPDTLLAAGDYVAPRNAVETLLAEGMAQLLGLERVGIQQDFFALGGHSLLVIKLVAGLRKQLQVEVHPGLVFDHPSVAGLADALRERESSPGALERTAQVRLKLNSLTPEQREALLAKSRPPVDA